MPHPRKDIFKKIARRGDTTIGELLTASFGEWPLKGLDIQAEQNQIVKVKPLAQMFKDFPLRNNFLARATEKILAYSRTAAITGINLDRIIYLNELIGKNPKIMIHELAHILQQDHGLYSSYEEVPSTFTVSNQVMQAFLDQAQMKIENKNDSKKFGYAFRQGKNYLLKGDEIQARLHEIMAAQYIAWGRMPTTKIELWAGLKSAGLVMPPAIAAELSSSSENITSFQKKCGHRKPVHDLNAVMHYLPQKSLVTFWQKILPLLYADLIEMYGDKLGRQRFGFKPRRGGLTISAPTA